GSDLSIHEVEEAAAIVQEAAHDDANIIFGAVIDPTLKDEVRMTVIATGFAEKTDISAPSGKVVDLPRANRPVTSSAAGGWRKKLADARAEIDATLGETSDDLDVPTFLRKRAD